MMIFTSWSVLPCSRLRTNDVYQVPYAVCGHIKFFDLSCHGDFIFLEYQRSLFPRFAKKVEYEILSLWEVGSILQPKLLLQYN